MSGANALLISPAARDALQSWLDHQRALKGAAENTLTAYQGDLVDFLAFMTLHKGDSQGLGALSKMASRARGVRAYRGAVDQIAEVSQKAAPPLGD